jgi:hypothetical protein
MATLKELSNRSNQKIFAEIFLKRRRADGSYDPDWLDISRELNGTIGGNVRNSIDSQDYDIGIFREDNVTLSFNNRNGRFNDVEDSRSFWAAYDSRHQSKIRIDYGYLDDEGEKVGGLVYTGLIDDRSVRISGDDQVSVTVLSRQSVFQNLAVAGGTFDSPVLASQALEIILTRTEVLEQFNIDPLLIDPDIDYLIDDPSKYNGQKLNQAINDILFFTNSVGFVDENDYFVVRGRRIGNAIKHKFYSNPEYSVQKDNVLEVRGMTSGRHRIKNLIEWSEVQAKSIPYDLTRYGVTRKSVSTDSITNLATRQQIVDRILEEWQYPKDEFEIVVDYMGSDVQILDLCTLDIQPEYQRHHDLPFVGEAIVGEAIAVGYENGIHIRPNRGFKVIAIDHNISAAKTTLKLREKGITNFDGYFDMLTTHKYDLVFTAQSSVSISTTAKSINAECAIVQVLDPNDDFAEVEMDIRRPDASTLTFNVGAPITKTFTALVLEILVT